MMIMASLDIVQLVIKKNAVMLTVKEPQDYSLPKVEMTKWIQKNWLMM